ncbi:MULTISPECIES: hypothetical protein [unclassified Alteromonas]|uniref:DUF6933 domain-containing protein n=1 Tax=unclassified Alteromonas TaxID=2614992 RepID=UPI000EC63CCE|nr:hypothetical protein [Alteromonas sp. CyTr2]MCG7650554.1 hypothetical protein [Alteromonas sp. MmMcT2-5]HCG87855.1 hypothetical protein [Alteromonas macleodii]
MILHCTKKLYAKLPEKVKVAEQTASAIGIQAQWLNWHANLITIQRRQCVIAVHDATRFTLFIPCLTKKDFANLDWHLNDVFINTLLKSDMPPELVNAAATNYQPLTFDTNCNRSVQGTMNQVAQEIDYGLYYKNTSVADISPYRYSANLSHRPCGVKGQKEYIWPDKEMAQLLQKLPKKLADSAANTNLH